MTHLTRRILAGALLATGAAALAPNHVHTQQPALTLGDLHRRAGQHDPRAAQAALNERATELREAVIAAERLPSVLLNASGQYQSHVARIPFAPPGGGTAPDPHHDIYDAHVAVRQPLLDPLRPARERVERGRLAEAQSGLDVALYPLRQAVDEAFFAALRLHAQRNELDAAIAGLESHLAAARVRVEQGVSLQGEVASLQAELLGRRQSMDELAVAERNALAALSSLTGQSAASASMLVLPELHATVQSLHSLTDSVRQRPEYAHYRSRRELLADRRSVISARDRPSVAAFGRAGYGRPGLNPLAQRFDSYWLAGVQVQWSPWSWGSTDRERAELEVQRQVLDTEEAAFTERVTREADAAYATIGRLLRTLASDEEIIALRERILSEARAQYREGVITSATFIDRENEALRARIARAVHRVELEQACARYLTILGVEVE